MRQFFVSFPIRHAVRDELSWTHYRLIMKAESEHFGKDLIARHSDESQNPLEQKGIPHQVRNDVDQEPGMKY